MFDELVFSIKQTLEDGLYFEADTWLKEFGKEKEELRKLESELKVAEAGPEREGLEKTVAARFYSMHDLAIGVR